MMELKTIVDMLKANVDNKKLTDARPGEVLSKKDIQ